MRDMHNNPIAKLIPFVVALFLFTSLFGMGVGMDVKDGRMLSCPFMASQTSICEMSAAEHIGQWQQAFLGVPAKSSILLLALLLIALAIIPFAKLFSQIRQSEIAAQLLTRVANTLDKIFDPILLAFSDGILKPKIYEPAHS